MKTTLFMLLSFVYIPMHGMKTYNKNGLLSGIESITFIANHIETFRLPLDNSDEQITFDEVNGATLDMYYELLQRHILNTLNQKELQQFSNIIRFNRLYMIPTPVTQSIFESQLEIEADSIAMSKNKKILYLTDNGLTYAYDTVRHFYNPRLINQQKLKKITKPETKHSLFKSYNNIYYGVLNSVLHKWDFASVEYAICTKALLNSKYDKKNLIQVRNTQLYKKLLQKEQAHLNSRINQMIRHLDAIENISNYTY